MSHSTWKQINGLHAPGQRTWKLKPDSGLTSGELKLESREDCNLLTRSTGRS